MKRDKYDDVFSKLVRARAGWACQRCGKVFPKGADRRGLHCSHVFGRRRHAVRWDFQNAFSHCYGCHSYLASNPDEFQTWAAGKIGEAWKSLVLRANSVKKWTPKEKEQLYKDMKAAWKTFVERGMD